MINAIKAWFGFGEPEPEYERDYAVEAQMETRRAKERYLSHVKALKKLLELEGVMAEDVFNEAKAELRWRLDYELVRLRAMQRLCEEMRRKQQEGN